MPVVSLRAVPRRTVDADGSHGFTVGGLGLTEDAHLVVVALGPGGVIGRHPAAGHQVLVLVLVMGDATVSGGDGKFPELEPGQAAVWEPGESHETRSAGGLTALVVEGNLEIKADDEPPPAIDAP